MIRPLLKLRGLGLIAFTAFALQIPAHAELTIEITGAGVVARWTSAGRRPL